MSEMSHLSQSKVAPLLTVVIHTPISLPPHNRFAVRDRLFKIGSQMRP